MVFLIDHYGVITNVSNIIGGCDLCKNVNLTFDISHLSIFVVCHFSKCKLRCFELVRAAKESFICRNTNNPVPLFWSRLVLEFLSPLVRQNQQRVNMFGVFDK
jgi:hypothetical protein